MAHTVKRHAWGSSATINATVIEARELVIDTDVGEVVLGDGSTVGGTRMQRKSAALDAIRAAGASAADKLFYWTSTTAGAFADLTSFGRSLVASANQAAARTVLGLTPGTDVQAHDADLDALAALSGTDTIYRRSGAGTWSAVTIGDLLSFSGGTLNAAGTGYATGRLYSLFGGVQSATQAVTFTLDTVVALVPFLVRKTVTLASLNLRVVTGAGSSAAKMGIWASDPTTGAPTGTPITNAASNTGQATTGNNTTPTIAASATLTPGLYWYGVALTTGSPTFRSIPANIQNIEALHGRAALDSNSSVSGWTAPYTYGNDITTLDLTAATLTPLLGAVGMPVMWIGT